MRTEHSELLSSMTSVSVDLSRLINKTAGEVREHLFDAARSVNAALDLYRDGEPITPVVDATMRGRGMSAANRCDPNDPDNEITDADWAAIQARKAAR